MLPSPVELARAYADGTLTPTAAVDAVLATVDRLDPELGAWQAVYHEEARRAAAQG